MSLLKRIYFLILVIFITLSARGNSQSVPWGSGLSKGHDLQIFLVEFSPGDNITDYFGHIAMVVKDTLHDISRVYNFGLFSFDEGFIRRFAMGRLIFYKAALSLSGSMKYYISSNRTIIFHELNLPGPQKKDLAGRLAYEVLPQNSQYLYHHYNDNCATRLRDLIDTAVDGQFKQRTDLLARFTLREHTLRYTEQDPLMQWLLMFLMNNTIDQPIMEWNEMFLPAELIHYAQKLSYQDTSGIDQALVKSSNTYYESGRPPVPDTADNWPFWTVLCGLLIPLTAMGLAFRLPQKAAWGAKLFFAFSALLTFIFGFIGLSLFFMALFTDHVVTYHNENLLLANPLTFFIFILSFISIFRTFPLLLRLTKWSWYCLAVMSVLLMLLKVFPPFDQDNLMIFTVLLPVNLAFAFIFYKIDFLKS